MNKFNLSLVFIISLFVLLSCDNIKKDTTASTTSNSEKMFSLEPQTTKVFWKGTSFEGQLNFISNNTKQANTIQKAVDGIVFSLPTSSLYTKEHKCESEIKNTFFGNTEKGASLEGSFKVSNDTLVIMSLKMNGITNEIPLSYFISGQMLSMRGVMDFDNWKMQNAFDSLYVACKQPVSEGISHEVGISVESYLKAE